MSGRLAAFSVIATLALAGTAIACPMEQSASNDQTVVTASAPAQTSRGDRDDHPENSGGRDRRLIGASGSKRQAAPGAAFLVCRYCRQSDPGVKHRPDKEMKR